MKVLTVMLLLVHDWFLVQSVSDGPNTSRSEP